MLKHFAGFLLGILCAGASLGATISVLPASQSVLLNQSFNVDFSITNVPTDAGVGAFDIDVNYDQSALGLTGVTFGIGLDPFGLGDIRQWSTVSNGINLFELSLDSSNDLLATQSSGFVLFRLSFQSLTAGATLIAASPNVVSSASGERLPVDVFQGTVQILSASPVPEPNTSYLLMTGIALALLTQTVATMCGRSGKHV